MRRVARVHARATAALKRPMPADAGMIGRESEVRWAGAAQAGGPSAHQISLIEARNLSVDLGGHVRSVVIK
jgi:hypothetical protein